MDFDWTDNIDIGLEVGKKYVVTSENGLIKYTMIYCGRGTTTHPHTGEKIDGHRFKDPNREKWDDKCNSWWSDGNLIEHMKSGRIEPYDESINEDLDWIKDADTYRGDYIIKRRSGRHTYVTVTDEYMHGPNNQPAVKYYIGDRLPVLALSPSQGSMLISTLREKIDNGQWERLGTFTEPRTSVYDSMLGESDDFGWVDTISDDPIKWKRPKVTLDNVEKDEDGWPVHYGDGEGEVWIDFEKYSNVERMEILRNIEKHLGKPLIFDIGGAREDNDTKIIMCTSNRNKAVLLHCGHEDNHFFSQENHVCCMNQNYQEFKTYEEEHGDEPFRERPIVDGGIFLNKIGQLDEGFYYKGVNPTVDLIVIRGNKVLLIKRGEDSEAEPGKWALPGGFHDSNAKKGEEWKEDKESSLEAAKREVKEETGLDVDSIDGLNFQLVGVFEGGGRDPRDKEDSWTRSTVYMVHIPESEGDNVKGMDDAQRAEWVPLDLVLQRKLAFDHHKIIEKAIRMNESDAFNNLNSLLTEDFDWTQDVGITKEAIRELLSNCEDVPVTNFNLNTNSPYIRRGKMNIFYYSMCPYWWDRLKDLPLNDEGRGKGEWFTDNDRGNTKIAVIMPDRNGVTDVRAEDNEDISAITYSLNDVEPYFNGKTNELWLFLDDNDKPRYDLLPDHLVDRVRKGFEGVEYPRELEENFEWTEDIPSEIDVDLWEKVTGDIDNEVSGPWSGNIRNTFSDLADILDEYNIDIEDMGNFFMYPPDGPKDKDGNDITNYQLRSLHQDLMDLGISLTPEQERDLNLESVNESDFDWVSDIKPVSVGDVFHTRTDFTPPDLNAEVTFEIYDISPDSRWVRFGHHKGSMQKGTYIDVDKINAHTITMGWDKSGYNGANSIKMSQVLKNINSNFWKKVNVPGYMTQHPEEYDRLIKLGSNINEDFDWTSDIPAGDSHRYFDINVCYESFYDEDTGEDECVEGGSYFVKIPVDVVPDIWDYTAEDWYMAGPGDEGLGVIEWSIENNQIDADDIDMFQYVTELPKEEWCRAWGRWNNPDKELCSEYITEDFDWSDEIQPEVHWDRDKYYVLDVRSLSGRELRETIDDVWDFAYNMDYDTEIGVTYDTVGYIYFEPSDEVPEGYALDWSDRKTVDPTFGGKYQMISLEEFYHMAYGDEPLIESRIINEGRYDNVTNELTKRTMYQIRRGKKRFEDKIKLFSRTFVDIVFYVKYSDEYDNPRVYAATHINPKAIRSYFKNKRIIFEVEVPTSGGVIINEHLPELLAELKNIIRHEIEHVTQFKFKDRQRKGFFSTRSYPENLTYVEYLTEPYETEAYVRGLYKKSKTLRKPFNDVLNDYFERLRIEGELTPEEVDTVKTNWLSYANKHLPMSTSRKYGYDKS
jgi:ADP-ribose pyrophosphatase YjhB (NUDIX family)